MEKRIIAITGPSGVGKSTLAEKLLEFENLVIPFHCTTRSRRSDDIEGLYRYLTHEEYSGLLKENRFLLSSGDGPIVLKEYGNFYGVLKEDCLPLWEKNYITILFVSYKDINSLVNLTKQGIEIDIINLRFSDIYNGVSTRLINDKRRNHTKDEINRRVASALDDEEKYGSIVETYAKCVVYTDILDIKQTYEKVCFDLRINDKPKKLIKKINR